MAIIRVNKTKDYTVMSNCHLRDKRLSLKAKGLLSIMLSLPDDWDYSMPGLVAICKENQTAVKTALNELKSNGYLQITKEYPTSENGGRIAFIYDIFEQPQNNQQQAKQPSEKQDIENLYIENQPQLNTDILSTEKRNTNNKTHTEMTLESDFEELWRMYPRKDGKKAAFTAYKRALKNGTTTYTIKQGISRYLAYIRQNNINPRYIKMGSTWFNGECWNDDYDIKVDCSNGYNNGVTDDLDEVFGGG